MATLKHCCLYITHPSSLSFADLDTSGGNVHVASDLSYPLHFVLILQEETKKEVNKTTCYTIMVAF